VDDSVHVWFLVSLVGGYYAKKLRERFLPVTAFSVVFSFGLGGCTVLHA